MARKVKGRNPRILIVTPEITYLPEGMGNLAGKMSAKAGGMADVSASLTDFTVRPEPIKVHRRRVAKEIERLKGTGK